MLNILSIYDKKILDEEKQLTEIKRLQINEPTL